MKIYIIRHGQDDDTVRGGWSNTELTDEGIRQASILANHLYENANIYAIHKIYSSDLKRAAQTSEIIGKKLGIDVEYEPAFREVNNGDLAGLKNEIADEKFPNLYWRKMQWSQKYPNGESPEEFYNRISSAWKAFVEKNKNYDYNILLVTHGGVINIIKSIINKEDYSNKNRYSGIPSCKVDLRYEIN